MNGVTIVVVMVSSQGSASSTGRRDSLTDYAREHDDGKGHSACRDVLELLSLAGLDLRVYGHAHTRSDLRSASRPRVGISHGSHTAMNAARPQARRRLALASAAILATSATLVGCAPAGDTSDLAMRPATADTTAPSALLEGVLHRDAGCTFVVRTDGTTVVPVFERGDAAWVNDALVLTGDGTASARAGDTVSLGGASAPYGVTTDMTIPPGCREYNEFWNASVG